ncbi:MAG: electron transfer flavoprotein subunit alpha/FixB family protein [Desulfobacterales bacterium]|nr:electron transfer flavoprotein subunit alpha/FixB family protein [Desulfobacterales bacterium]
MTRPIVVIAEHLEGKIRPATYELIAFALELRQAMPAPIKVLILGNDPEDMAHLIAAKTGLDVMAVQESNRPRYNGDLYKNILAPLLSELNPDYVCIAQTPMGMDFAPGLAHRLGAVCITGVESVYEDRGRILFTRAFYNGKILADICVQAKTAVLTVAPGFFKPSSADPAAPGRVEIRKTPGGEARIRTVETRKAPAQESEIAQAPVIVSAGRGVGKKENLALIFTLAALFPLSAVAGSRWICVAGWLEHRRQVGLTGAVVSPKLYIACGISGSVQHLAGMRDSGFIVAVNSDPHAAIFNIADICIVEDLNIFIPALIEAHRQKT